LPPVRNLAPRVPPVEHAAEPAREPAVVAAVASPTVPGPSAAPAAPTTRSATKKAAAPTVPVAVPAVAPVAATLFTNEIRVTPPPELAEHSAALTQAERTRLGLVAPIAEEWCLFCLRVLRKKPDTECRRWTKMSPCERCKTNRAVCEAVGTLFRLVFSY